MTRGELHEAAHALEELEPGGVAGVLTMVSEALAQMSMDADTQDRQKVALWQMADMLDGCLAKVARARGLLHEAAGAQ